MTDEHIRQRLRGWKKLKKESADTNNAETKHEQWKIDEYKNHLNVVCSNCNKKFYVYKQGQYRIDRSNYCPNCGAKMNRERERYWENEGFEINQYT